MLEFIKQPWPWYVAGPLIGLTVPLLLILGNKTFGISSSLRHVCAICVPANIPFNWPSLFTLKGFLLMVVGGFLVGFGTRYAGGCTSGHAIMGLSNLQWPSLIATCCFMAGGFIVANLMLPLILSL
mgnify:CR=1 FL=1